MDRAEAALRIAEQALSEARGALRAIASLTADSAGALLFVAPDGELVTLGSFKGEPGEDGKGEPGKDGKNGRDGFGFDDMIEELAEDGRTIIRRYTRGDQVKEFRHTFPVIIDRGVYKPDAQYQRGDAVSFGGSLWIAQRDTADKPETTDAWRLSVKRGRDGKDGVVRGGGTPPTVKVG